MNKELQKHLNRASNFAQVDLTYLLKGGFWLTLTQGTAYAGSFVLAVVFANFVDAETYGNYNYVLSMFGLFSLFSLPGIDTAITQSVAKGQEKSFFTGFDIKLKYSLLSSLGLVIMGVYYFSIEDHKILSIPLFLGAVITPLMYSSQIFTAFFAGRKMFFEQTKARVAVQMLSYITTIISLIFTHNLIVLILVYLISNALGNIFFYYQTKTKFSPNKKDDKETIRYGKHLSAMRALNIGASYLDRFLIFNFLGPVELAIYSFALNPVRQLMLAFQNFGHLLLPKFSEKTMKQIDQKFFSRMFQLIAFGVLISVFYIAAAPILFKVFFPKYMASLGYSQLFALVLVVQPVAPYFSSIFRSQKLTRSLYISSISSQVILLLLIFILGYYFQSIGIIWARVIVSIFSLGLAIVLWQKEMKKNIG